MPTYVYRCTSCGANYERRESFSAPTQHDCPECGKTSRRMPVAPPIVFKGSGFYKTESRGSANGGSESSGSSDGGSSSESSSSPPSPAPAAGAGGHDHGHGHSHGPGGHTH
ncbi:MAG: FmdB family transcriptional regulator [Dehalococcoidia bacterium]|nr:FmdB family transcriptional regulator [Dehalococcoidia bacterium]